MGRTHLLTTHFIPEDDGHEHIHDSGCDCKPRLERFYDVDIYVHVPYDGREMLEHERIVLTLAALRGAQYAELYHN